MYNKPLNQPVYNNKTEKFIIGILVLTALIFLVLWRVTAYVCADQVGHACQPTLPIPTDEYLPNMTPTPTYLPTPTFIPSDTPIQPTISPTPTIQSSPTAGESATTTNISTAASAINAPVAAPATGRVR